MSKSQFSEQELAFFEEGDTLTDEVRPAEDFRDLDEPSGESRSSSWVERALSALSLVTMR